MFERGIQLRGFSDHKERKRFKLDTLPFSVSPQDAMTKFDLWATTKQGLPYYKVSISAAFVPVWSFDLNVRFKTAMDSERAANGYNRHTYSWKPGVFDAAYPRQDIIHLPGLATYSGYTYRRSLVDPIHNKTLLFLGHTRIPFAPHMLDAMPFVNPENGERESIQIFPDPWNATEATALKIVKDQLVFDMDDITRSSGESVETNIEVQVVASNRVYLPTYIFDYSVLGGGEGYRSFVSGCDAEMPVSGISHQAFSVFEEGLSTISSSVNIPGPLAVWLASNFGDAALRNVVTFTSRLVVRFPFFTIIAFGIFKFWIPRIRNHMTLEQWKEQREYDARHDHYHSNHFFDSSFASKRYFESNRDAILRILSQIKSFNHTHYGSAGNGRQGQNTRKEYRKYYYSDQEKKRGGTNGHQSNSWEGNQNNADNPYHVLGIKKSATMGEVSAAFRREMLKHHPDMNANASEPEKVMALERSKMITEAYRRIKQKSKG